MANRKFKQVLILQTLVRWGGGDWETVNQTALALYGDMATFIANLADRLWSANFIANCSGCRILSVKYINKYSYPEFLNRIDGYASSQTKFKLNHKCLPWNNEILSTPTTGASRTSPLTPTPDLANEEDAVDRSQASLLLWRCI